MDVSASLGSINSLPAYVPAAPAASVKTVAAPIVAHAGASTSSTPQLAAELTSAPSPTRSAVDAAVARLPASVRYAPSNPPREATLAAPLDVTV